VYTGVLDVAHNCVHSSAFDHRCICLSSACHPGDLRLAGSAFTRLYPANIESREVYCRIYIGQVRLSRLRTLGTSLLSKVDGSRGVHVSFPQTFQRQQDKPASFRYTVSWASAADFVMFSAITEPAQRPRESHQQAQDSKIWRTCGTTIC
jgi:hypothetical protein